MQGRTSEISRPDFEVLHESRIPDAPMPRVSVCVSLFDYQHYIRSCLDSVAAQTATELSLIVVDDASSDGGEKLVQRWMQDHEGRFADLRLLRQDHNQGLAATRNRAIECGASEFVFVLDADNEIRPRCIEVLVAALDQSSAGFAYSIIEQFGQVQSLTGCDAWSPRLLARGNYIDAMALLRRDTWLRVGGYRAMRTPGWEDFDFWCRCVEAQVDGLLVPEILCRYRVHAKSMLRRTTDTLRNHLLVCDELRKAHPWVEF